MGDRHFIRCLLRIPFTDRTDEYFGWGLWVEVQPAVFERYLKVFDQDASGEPAECGILANRIRCYEDAAGESVSIQFSTADWRPDVLLDSRSTSSLAKDQMNGIDESRFHAILLAASITT
jgi:hypothetical protein